MLKFLRKRAVILAAAFFLFPVAGIALAGPAHAQQEWNCCQFCAGNLCFNGWNGGPSVRQYAPNVTNNDFDGYYDPNRPGAVYLQFIGGGPYTGWCIGDSGDGSGNATTGLVGCPSGNNTGGWGANFVPEGASVGCLGGTYAFYNQHWGGYVAPAAGGNGAEWYLNTPYVYCFSVYSAALVPGRLQPDRRVGAAA